VKAFVLRLVQAGFGAFIASLAFPQPGIWPLLFVGVPLMVFAFRCATVGESMIIGAVTGFVYYGAVAKWLSVYLGLAPWLGLVGLQTVLFAVGGIAIGAAWRGVDTLNLHSISGRLQGGFFVAAAWVAREAIAAQFPWGGFGWARVSHGLADSPFRYLGTLFGLTGASAVIVLVGVAYVLTWQNISILKGKALHLSGITVGLVALLPFPYLLLATAPSGSVRVAAVQGNSDSALFSSARQGDAVAKHVAAMNDANTGVVDVVIWPENAMDIDPLRSAEAAALADSISLATNAPFIFGTITVDGDKTFNSVLKWQAGEGAVDQYDKVHPVPFAEYLPNREFFYPLAPSMFDMVPRDYTIGTRDPVMTAGDAIAGIAICYDIVDDALFRDMLANNANVIFAPTNNSDFGRTDESIQQLGIARMRAVETGRSVVNVSTVGVSAVIAPDGSDLDRLEPFTPGVMVANVPLSTVVTPASVIGLPLEWALIVMGLVPVLGLRRKREK
jgi:apolipoprotein N-acyltransferase